MEDRSSACELGSPLPFLGEVYKRKAEVKAAAAQHQYGATVILSISPSLAGFNLVAVQARQLEVPPRSRKQDPTDEIAKRANCEDAERPMWLPERCVCPVDVPADTKDHEDYLDSTNIGTGAMDVDVHEDERYPCEGFLVIPELALPSRAALENCLTMYVVTSSSDMTYEDEAPKKEDVVT
ncbi:hypothetical protein STEG23_013701 [Scotinomys teguina]